MSKSLYGSRRDELTRLLPTCARCGVKVWKIETWRDTAARAQIYEVTCHGETERTAIPDSVAYEGPMQISGGEAFTTKRLPA